uniref:Uncharacterized protein n=1 Tax=Rhizophora mucronata TaxID=61149 RepID=A0A2P2QUC9_RHIMU
MALDSVKGRSRERESIKMIQRSQTYLSKINTKVSLHKPMTSINVQAKGWLKTQIMHKKFSYKASFYPLEAGSQISRFTIPISWHGKQ